MPDRTSIGWLQLNLTCDNWQSAEQVATEHLGPLLSDAEDSGLLASWWFVRKGATWRLRLLPTHGTTEAVTAFIDETTAALTQHGVRQYTQSIYEPETHAFGGPDAMELAHALFHADSRNLLHHLRHTGRDHRRELGLLLSTRLAAAAGQDWYEQGDIWAQVAAHRAGNADVPAPGQLDAVRTLLTATGNADGSPLHTTPAWQAAYQRTGAGLAALAADGTLTRGLRAVLAHHVLFTFNRHGVSAHDQHVLATTASHVIFQQDPHETSATIDGTARAGATTVGAVTTGPTVDATPEQLRDALVEYIRGWNVFRTPQVETAFRTVPRHLFLPGVDLATAYGRKPVVTKRAEDGSSISSASSPSLVAAMLEQLGVHSGQKILEIGAATGINAALLAELTGPTGTVVSIELDDDLAAGARAALDRAGYPQVKVICGDGALGHPDLAPYDRIIVTAEAWDIAPAWWNQLAVGGRLVVPLRLHGSGLTRAIGFTHNTADTMVSTSAEVCGFVPMRGTSTFGERYVQLADHVVLRLDGHDLPDDTALADALTHARYERWTGVQVHDNDPAQHLDLWLLTTTNGRFGRLSVGAQARTDRVADPAMRWAGAGLYNGGTIAYVAARPITEEINELGVVAHGPDSDKLAAELCDLLHRWDQGRPSHPTITAHRITANPNVKPSPAQILRPGTRLDVTW